MLRAPWAVRWDGGVVTAVTSIHTHGHPTSSGPDGGRSRGPCRLVWGVTCVSGAVVWRIRHQIRVSHASASLNHGFSRNWKSSVVLP